MECTCPVWLSTEQLITATDVRIVVYLQADLHWVGSPVHEDGSKKYYKTIKLNGEEVSTGNQLTIKSRVPFN